MWYDEIGLLKPAVVKENGYRCYTYAQSSALETILMLRELNVSLSDIRTFMEHRSADSLERLLSEKINEVDLKISHLQAIRHTLASRQNDMKTLLDTDLSEIRIIEKEKTRLVTVPTSINTPFEQEIEMVMAETKKYHIHRLYDVSYGAMISTDNLKAGRFEDYAALFIEMPVSPQKKRLHIKPGRTYLRAFHQGSYNSLYLRYQEILAYAEEHHLCLHGYSYETGINDIVIDSLEDYITQIEIPVLIPE